MALRERERIGDRRHASRSRPHFFLAHLSTLRDNPVHNKHAANPESAIWITLNTTSALLRAIECPSCVKSDASQTPQKVVNCPHRDCLHGTVCTHVEVRSHSISLQKEQDVIRVRGTSGIWRGRHVQHSSTASNQHTPTTRRVNCAQVRC
jgi:hypothetical protein